MSSSWAGSTHKHSDWALETQEISKIQSKDKVNILVLQLSDGDDNPDGPQFHLNQNLFWI